MMTVLSRWIPAAVRRPSGVVASMRWLYLVAAILALLLTLPAPLAVANPVTATLTVTATAGLIVSWIAGYRLGRNSVWLDAADALAIAAFALACPAPPVVFSIAFSGLWYRSLYGSVSRIAVTCAIYAGGLCAMLLVWPLVPNGFPAPPPASIIGPMPAMFLVAIVGRMLGASLFVREESARRDAALANAGTALLNAHSREEIISLAGAATAEICAATPGLRSIAVFPDEDGVMVTHPAGPFAQRPTSVPDHVVGRDADGRAISVRDPRFLDELAGTVCAWLVIPSPDRKADGYLLLGTPKRVPNEAVLAMTSVLNQVAFAVLKWQDHQSITRQARTDALTGLANRTAFTAALDRVAGPAAVLFLDLDDFKKVNDGRGHAAGDKLLREVAARLTAAAGPGAVAARLGGDEFALIVTGRSADEVDSLAEVLVAEISKPVRVAGADAFVGASVGIADTTTAPDDPDLLLRQADQAMYAAKMAGKNQVRRYDSRDRNFLTAA
jgi:diguanylate cyclase (GGDEF)-like protein